MTLANDLAPTRADLAALHKALISLLIDTSAYRQFVQSPEDYANRLARIPQVYRNLISRINCSSLDIFRDIVHGTRRERFGLIFSILAEKLDDLEAFNVLVGEFIETKIVQNGRNDLDVRLFADHIREQKEDVLGDLAGLDCLMYAASNAMPPEKYAGRPLDLASGQVSVHPSVQLLRSSRPVRSLLGDSLQALRTMQAGAHITMIYPADLGGNVKFKPLPVDAGLLLAGGKEIAVSQLSAACPDGFALGALFADGCLAIKRSDA
ncbi:MAG: hypothetical protein WCC66_07245 [Rhizobiaceae bacterium]